MMTLTVREMTGSEVDIIIDHFQKSTPEDLEILGVGPANRMLSTSHRIARCRRPASNTSDAHDGAWSAQLSSGRKSLDDRTMKRQVPPN
jgi:hypothetical protein